VEQLHGHDCHQNVTEPQATRYHTKSIAYTCVQYRNCESGLAKACCTQAGPAHAASHMEMAWIDKSTLASFFKLTCTASSPHHCSQKRSESIDMYRNCESGNNDKQHRQIAMWLLLLLQPLNGKVHELSRSVLLPLHIEEVDC